MRFVLSLITLYHLSVATIASASDTTLEALQSRLVGNWTSIACELRPQANNVDSSLAPTPTYLQRNFTFDSNSGFEANITVYADPACDVAAASYDFAGEIRWHDENPAVEGAWSQDYVLNKKLQLTIMAPPMAEQLNALPEGACGEGLFVVGQTRDILGKPCVLLTFVDNDLYVVDHDFLFVPEYASNMLFMGAKHVDGTGFYHPENRPTVGLQQPLVRVKQTSLQ